MKRICFLFVLFAAPGFALYPQDWKNDIPVALTGGKILARANAIAVTE